MNIQKHIEYWEKSAKHDLETEFTLDKFKKIKEKYEWLKQKIK